MTLNLRNTVDAWNQASRRHEATRLATAGVCFFLFLSPAAGQDKNAPRPAARDKSSVSDRKASARRSGRPAHGRLRKSKNSRAARLSHRFSLAQVHLEPQRVEEIQQALIREGYLREEPNGRWDSLTRDAMMHYQADNKFAATGLPEAKSLMKLGLGAHPLPPELDPKSEKEPSNAPGASQ